MKLLSFLVVILISSLAVAEDASAPAPQGKVKYKSGKDINFEELLIQGQLKRPEIAVVTGNVDNASDGLLRLRENFLDRIAIDNGEEIP